MQHIDFEETNACWTWTNDDSFAFERVFLNNVIAGDTDSGMFKVPDVIVDRFDSQDELVEFADEIGRRTNDAFPEFIVRAFNAPESRRDSVLTDREIVSDVALFVSKKRYALHVINDEGKPVDKKKIMGLEIKKSDTPKAVKKMLTTLVDAMLAKQSEQEVNELVTKMKDEYRHHSLTDIARPISVKGLQTYSAQFEKTGSMNGFPYNIRAAMYYNSLCGNSDRKVVPGDKIGIVYINEKDSKYVGFPIDSPVPDFVKDMSIDYNTQWDKAYKKIHSYMSAVGWDFKSKKADTRKSLFGEF